MPVNKLPVAESRFVVLLHQPGPQSERTRQAHFDWMFESDGALRTWATPPIDLWQDAELVKAAPIETECEPLANHRLAYLDYEGEVSRGRGSVARQTAGTYQLMEDRPDHFRVVLRWLQEGKKRTAEVEIYRSFFGEEEGRVEERRESWRLRFSAGRYETN